jgi:hypothetical protein
MIEIIRAHENNDYPKDIIVSELVIKYPNFPDLMPYGSNNYLHSIKTEKDGVKDIPILMNLEIIRTIDTRTYYTESIYNGLIQQFNFYNSFNHLK